VTVFCRLSDALSDNLQMGQVIREAFDQAVSKATEFAHDYPIFCTVITIRVLVILMPWLLAQEFDST
jgi:hypothetical protein